MNQKNSSDPILGWPGQRDSVYPPLQCPEKIARSFKICQVKAKRKVKKYMVEGHSRIVPGPRTSCNRTSGDILGPFFEIYMGYREKRNQRKNLGHFKSDKLIAIFWKPKKLWIKHQINIKIHKKNSIKNPFIFETVVHYLKNKVGVVDFANAQSAGFCKIYYSHFIFEVQGFPG